MATQATAAAMRAAEHVMSSYSPRKVAEIIDRETGLPELLRACRLIAGMAVAWEPLTPGDIAEVHAAIAKAEGRDA